MDKMNHGMLGNESGRIGTRLMQAHALNIVAFLFMALTVACHPVQEIKMDPMRFVAIQTTEGIRVELADAPALFKKATKFLRKKKYKAAALRYKMLLKYYPKDDYAVPAMYNLGMSLVGMKEYEEARKIFEKYIKTKALAKKDRCDGMEKLADALSKSGKHKRAVIEFNVVAKKCVEKTMSRIRVDAKLAHEHNALRDPAMAMKAATSAMRLYRINKELAA